MQPSLGVMVSHEAPDLLDRDYVRNLAALLEDEQCESVWLRDHPALAKNAHGLCFPSPLEWLTLVAAYSTSLKLGTAGLVLPFQHPTPLPKRLATVARLSNGRCLVGPGVAT